MIEQGHSLLTWARASFRIGGALGETDCQLTVGQAGEEPLRELEPGSGRQA